ncbi:MAG TPA: GtrA family protein [Opitutaceae bacterium]|nr:GtrA family protein [Opitutaceae bacterium]
MASVRLVRFACVGGVVTLFFMGFNALLARGLGLGAQSAFLVSYPPALALHFTLNKLWTFGDSRATSARHVGEYLFSVVVTFLIQWPAFTALHGMLRLAGWVAAGGANVIQMTASYLFLRHRVFAVPTGAEPAESGSAWHRLALLLAAVGASALIAWTALGVWELPEVGPRQYDYFNLLVSGFRKGSLALDAKVPDALIASKNPYDPAVRPPGVAPHDVSYYKGRYYLYFGVVPVVTLFWPFRALTGHDLSMSCAATAYGLCAFWVVAWLWVRVVRDGFPRASLATKLGGLLAAGLAGGQLALVRRTSFWEIPIAAGYLHMACAAAAAYLALSSRRPWAWLALAGLSLGLAVGCRPPLAAAGGGIAAIVVVIAWREHSRGAGGGWLRPLAQAVLCAGIPLAAVVGGLLWYNAARFGNPLEFGLNYQLTGTGYEMKARHFSLTYAPFNLAVYFWAPPQWGRYFPFIHPIHAPAPAAGYYGLEYVYGALVVCPVIWLCGLFPAWIVRRSGQGPAAFASFMFVVALGTTGVLLCFNTAAGRYVADFLPWWVWLGLLVWAALERELQERGLRGTTGALAGAFTVCAAYSCALAFLQSADIHGILEFENPAAYARISRCLDLPAALWERHTGQRMGALEMDVVFPEKTAGSYAPLVVTGVEFQADYVFVFSKSPQLVQLGYATSGSPPVLGEAIAIQPGRSYHLRIEEGSLFPPAGHPVYDGWRPFEVRALKNWTTVVVDGRPVLRRIGESHEASPGSVRIGHDRENGTFGARFDGVVSGVRRDELRRPQNGENGSGDVRLELTLPSGRETQIQPLIVAGNTGRADLMGLRMIDDDHFRLVYESWGAGLEESGALAAPPTRDVDLRVRLGELYRADGGPPGAALGDSIVAWMDGEPVWWLHSRGDIGIGPPLELAANAIGSSAMVPFFQGRVRGWNRGPAPQPWHPGAFAALELDLGGRGAGTEPLVATGRAGLADTLGVEWLSGAQALLVYDHWGTSAVCSAPFDWTAERIHTIRLELPAFSRLDSGPAADSATGRLVARLDGRTVWDLPVQCNAARSDTLVIGRNSAGSSVTAQRLSCVVADVRQVDPGAAPIQR